VRTRHSVRRAATAGATAPQPTLRAVPPQGLSPARNALHHGGARG
jgi:hypothetical protein